MAFLDIVVIAVLGVVLFGVPMRATPWRWRSVCDPVASAWASPHRLGRCAELDTANMAAFLVAFLPAFLLSGFAFALDQIPPVLEWISRLFRPATW